MGATKRAVMRKVESSFGLVNDHQPSGVEDKPTLTWNFEASGYVVVQDAVFRLQVCTISDAIPIQSLEHQTLGASYIGACEGMCPLRLKQLGVGINFLVALKVSHDGHGTINPGNKYVGKIGLGSRSSKEQLHLCKCRKRFLPSWPRMQTGLRSQQPVLL